MNQNQDLSRKSSPSSFFDQLSDNTLKILAGALAAAGVALGSGPARAEILTPTIEHVTSQNGGRVIVLAPAEQVKENGTPSMPQQHWSHASHSSHNSHYSHYSRW